ncbi:MAG: hypothetical protein KC996_04205 [Phycisphaerales bacterium]|nr:hypothetical protein [Phycisphaerales bacterium]
MKISGALLGGILGIFAMWASPAAAQSGGPYEIVSYTIDGGGTTNASGGVYDLGGTIGQPDAGMTMTGGSYSLTGGFWATVNTVTCAADFTGDGTLDIFDVFAFLDAFNAMDPSADFVVDGIFDVFDVFAFLDAFNAGCP